jgi:hypothetical protein
MNRGRLPVVASVVVFAALAAAGCGVGAGKSLGQAELTVTRDFGARRVAGPVRDRVTESDTVMRLLEREANISTRYGGGFVQSIDGIEGAERGGRRHDWFYYVDGVEATVGAADYALRGGDAVWWDYRDWSAATGVPAVVGSWPQPFAGGYDGGRPPVALECLGGGPACAEVRRKLIQAGVRGRLLSRISAEKTTAAEKDAGGAVEDVATPAAAAAGAIRVLVGPWARLRRDPAAAQIEDGPAASGVFAKFVPLEEGPGGQSPATGEQPPAASGPHPTVSRAFRLEGLDEGGRPIRSFGPVAGLVAATRQGEAPPVWVVTGAGARGVRAAAGALDSHDLRDRYAVVVNGGKAEPLPLRSSMPGSGGAR